MCNAPNRGQTVGEPTNFYKCKIAESPQVESVTSTAVVAGTFLFMAATFEMFHVSIVPPRFSMIARSMGTIHLYSNGLLSSETSLCCCAEPAQQFD